MGIKSVSRERQQWTRFITMTAQGTPQFQIESLQRALAAATERAEKAEAALPTMAQTELLAARIGTLQERIERLTRERDEATQQIGELDTAVVSLTRELEAERGRLRLSIAERKGEVWYWQGDSEDHLESLTCPVVISADKLRGILKQLETERAGSAAMLAAFSDIGLELRDNLKCHHPPDDGSDDLCDGEDCLLCGVSQIIAQALSSTAGAEMLAELRDLRAFKAAHETPKGSAGMQCCDPVIDGEIGALAAASASQEYARDNFRLRERVTTLEAALEEARKDTTRLDFLDKEAQRTGRYPHKPAAIWFSIDVLETETGQSRPGWAGYPKLDLRKAIDAAHERIGKVLKP